MEMLFYRVITIKRLEPFVIKLSNEVSGEEAVVNLIRSSTKPFHGWTNSERIKFEIKAFIPRIKQIMPSTLGGVVLCLGIEEKNGMRKFLSMHIAGSGHNADVVMKSYMNRPRFVQGAPTGSQRKNIYIWITSQHHSEIPLIWQQKQTNIINTHQILRRYVWGQIAPKYDNFIKDWNYNAIAIHHSGNKGMKDPLEIEKYHMNNNNFDDIGYHYMIHQNGKIYEGREIFYRGSHIAGMNSGKIGILMLGDFDTQWWDSDDSLTKNHINKLKKLITTLKQQFPTITFLGGHKEYSRKASDRCPGSLLMKEMDKLRKESGLNAP